MAQTYAQIHTPLQTYGKQPQRGKAGEQRAARELRAKGYSVKYNNTHPQGIIDLTATKNGHTKKIQVKNITSRNLTTKQTARKRIAGKPFGIKRIPKGIEVWVYDKSKRKYTFK